MEVNKKTVSIMYTNWKGVTSERRIKPYGGLFYFGQTKQHPEPQWLLDAFDLNKGADRTFAVKDIHE